MNDAVISRIRQLRLIPVIVIDDPKKAVPLARALEAGGIPCAEITFRTPGALESLERIAAECPNVLIGAGTVLNAKQAASARSAGAKFIVAPGFGPAVVDYCLDHDVEVFPGVATPTEVEAAIAKGLSVLKFFPAETLGGLPYLKALSAPYGASVEFNPSGGINMTNVAGYLSFSKVVACGATWLAPPELVAAGQFDQIRDEAARAVALVSALPPRVKRQVNGADGVVIR